MQRIVLRHLNGSKANQVEEFPLSQFRELIIGRDPSATVKYDPDRDDLVGRQHAKISQNPNDPNQFFVTDMNSRNGTFVNKQRIAGAAMLNPGDLVQFGAGGPEFQFDIEPRPASMLKPTREASSLGGYNPVPATREGGVGGTTPYPGAAATDPGRVGKATVERMIAQQRGDSRKYIILSAAALLVIVAMVAAGLIYKEIRDRRIAEEQGGKISSLGATVANVKDRTAALTPAEIVQKYAQSVVFVEFSWKLIYPDTGGQVYHEYTTVRDPATQRESRVALYSLRQGGQGIDPKLTLEPRGNTAIGFQASGSGFVITGDGFILTNRHVAANWFAPYPAGLLPGGYVLDGNGKVVGQVQQGPGDWIPYESVKNRSLTGKALEGRNDILQVTFPSNKLRIPAQLARVSDENDVAMIKISLPEPLPKVDLFDNYDSITQGEPITVIGYPMIEQLNPEVVRARNKAGQLGGSDQVVLVPEPTVTNGIIGRVIKAGNDPNNYLSVGGDSYQHNAATNPGNSGGPIFDQFGRVIAVHNAGIKAVQGANYGVPIKYGLDLMGTKTVSR